MSKYYSNANVTSVTMFLLKFIFYSIYSLGVVIFSYYVSLSYLYTYHKDWFYNDIKNNSVYDYIIGEFFYPSNAPI
uniref:Uncharacterized protein n=1 Tax=Trichogramma kaykai TaxID=54128 RepID=A0ABD2WBM3_9HYME